MKFSEAFKLMKQGVKVKLPSWGGYWYWDAEKRTIMIQCRPQGSNTQGKLLDIRETQRVEYTTMNMQSDEWIIADETNCPILGGEATFSFGEAIKYLRRGLKVKRKGWNGNVFLFLADEIHFFTKAVLQKKDDEPYDMLPSIAMKIADDKCVVGWLASQTDMLAEDWIFAE